MACIFLIGLAGLALALLWSFANREPNDPGPLTLGPGGPMLYGERVVVAEGTARRVILWGRNRDFGDNEHDDIRLFVEVTGGERVRIDHNIYFDLHWWSSAMDAAEKLAAGLQVPLVIDYK